jgi:acid phosphatase type 7
LVNFELTSLFHKQERMNKSILTLLIIVFFTQHSYSQIIIDNFDDQVNTNWVPGSSKYTLQETGGYLKVTANGTGSNFEGFGKTFPSVNMSKHSIITMKIMVPTGAMAPRIRMDVSDNNGYDSNKFPIIINTVADSIYHEYTFNFAGKFQASWPISTNLVAGKISRIYFYTSMVSGTHTGALYIDDITVEEAQDPAILKSETDWKFFDSGSLPAANWMDKTYDDSGWSADSSQFGYGDSDEKTVVSFGPDANNKYTTTYFRKKFNFIDTTVYKNIILNYYADDGVALYLNGTELYRDNLPSGTLSYSTLASAELTDSLVENKFRRLVFSEILLDSGENVLAAEVHQASAASDDLSFNLSITGTEYATGLTRGPYLQSMSDTSIVIRWRTLEKTESTVRYGSSFSSLTSTVSDPTLTTEHEVVLTGLSPATNYFYSIGTTGITLSGGNAEHYFRTAPAKGSIQPVTIWAIGDAGKITYEQRSVRDSYYQYNAGKHTDVWLLLGDNAYNEGTDEEYQLSMFENMFEAKMRNTALWPTPGNHDLRSYMAPGKMAPYYDIFSTPINGEAGGIASGTEGYYSFDYANIHFVSLDSYGNSRDSTAGMATWLKADLAATTQKWIIAYWHHPPYSKGSNDSDGSSGEDLKMREMREQILPILDKYGVDLVLNGHSHNYERSYMIHGHYGNSSTFMNEPHIINSQTSGNRALGEEYYKNPTHATLPDKGVVYGVMGCSGLKSGSVKWTSQASNLITNALMDKSMNQYLGSMVIEVNKDTLTAKFVDNSKNVQDEFTMIKDNTKDITLITATSIFNRAEEKNMLSVYPNPTSGEVMIKYTLEKSAKVELELFDEKGKRTDLISLGKKSKGEYEYMLNIQSKEAGLYTLYLKADKNTQYKKILKVK